MTNVTTPGLVRPPLVEVVCGARFKPIPAFDTLRHGLFWSRIRDRFPRAEVHPLLAEPNARIVSDVPLQRTWFVSADEQYVIQLQLDRFYLNWRQRGAPYPRFGGADGVHARFAREYEGFRVFLRDALDEEPEMNGLELSKVDLLRQPADWTDIEDLGAMMPRLRTVIAGQPADDLNFSLGFTQPTAVGPVRATYRAMRGADASAVHAEFRLHAQIDTHAALDAAFGTANEAMNLVFQTEFPDSDRRFGSRLQ